MHEPGAHNFILSSLGLYLDLLAGRWTRYFGFIYGPRHAAASRGKVASVASALAESGGGTIEKIPPPSIYLSATDCWLAIIRGNKHSSPAHRALNATVSNRSISRGAFVPSRGVTIFEIISIFISPPSQRYPAFRDKSKGNVYRICFKLYSCWRCWKSRDIFLGNF